jgi:hypothetical protein
MRTVLSLGRKAVMFEVSLYRSLFRWATHRPDVPPGAVPFAYVGAVAVLLWAFIIVSTVELVVVHVLLPWETLRLIADIVGIWGLVWMLGFAASLTVNPHAVADTGLLVRHGTGTDLTVPWDAISTVSVRERSHDKSKTVQLDSDGPDPVLMVVVASRTNVDIVLSRPLTFPVRGSEGKVSTIRLYADDARGLAQQVRAHVAV